jgi:glycosyltransferase involved in cell wall biosynthesis
VKKSFLNSIQYVDHFLCNSNNVKERIRAYTGKEATVVYPPVEVESYKYISQGDYYLSTARLEDHKRVELIIKAFMKMPDKKLVVASGGSQENMLKKLAKGFNNITFTGWIDKEQLVDIMGRCIASVYIPIDEDFGISPVESMAAGKPVIGVNEGGLKETIIHEKTGLLISGEVTLDKVIKSVQIMDAQYAYTLKQRCIERAQKFNTNTFVESISHFLKID